MNKKTKIARIYCRVSTKEQNLDRQLDLKHWAEQRDFYVAKMNRDRLSQCYTTQFADLPVV